MSIAEMEQRHSLVLADKERELADARLTIKQLRCEIYDLKIAMGREAEPPEGRRRRPTQAEIINHRARIEQEMITAAGKGEPIPAEQVHDWAIRYGTLPEPKQNTQAPTGNVTTPSSPGQ